MRLIRTLVADADREEVLALLDDYDVDYVLVHEEGERADRTLVEFPLPTQAVESVLEELRAVRNGRDAYTVVASAETVVTEHAEELEERFITGTEEDDSIATEEIRTTALDMTPSPQTYYAMTLLSALVATAGLLLDSPAIVVGSMVIAPLVGSALTASVGTVLTERSMIVEGFKTQLLGLSLAVLGAALFSFGLKSAAFLPPPLDIATTEQIAGRISPGLLSVVVGVCAGGAGAFGLATGVSVTLVGVMIAAALIPAAAAVGIGVAWGIESIALGAALLVMMNAIAIHLAATAVLWYLGYRPTWWTGLAQIGAVDRRQLAGLLASLLLLGGVLAGAGGLVATHTQFEQQVNRVTADVLAADRYAALDLRAVRTQFGGTPLPLARAEVATVVVGRPADRTYPALGREIGRQIAAETGRTVEVVVEFVERQRYEPEGAPTRPSLGGATGRPAEPTINVPPG
jgi:uncharacterized hydrophobic protein (TIGR00341 family)